MVLNLKKLLPGIPTEIRIFLVRALVIFVGWKLLYHLVLFPVRFPDKILTEFTAKVVSIVYKGVVDRESEVSFVPGMSEGRKSTVVFINSKPILSIADGCNALEPSIVYIGFLFCFRNPFKRQLKYILIGLAAIFILNILRCIALLWLKQYNNDLFYFAHHYLFNIVVYSFIFYFWYLYSKKINFAT